MPRRPLPIYAFFFAAYPVLALWAHNVAWVPADQVVTSFAISWISAAIFFLAARLVLRDTARAAWVTGLAVILFFSYGHMYGVLKSAGLGATLGRHRYLAPVWAALFIAGSTWAIRRPTILARLTPLFNWVAAGTWLLPTAALIAYAVEPSRPTPLPTEHTRLAASLHRPLEDPPPDIYFIVVDAYARADMLEKVFDYDNTDFLSSMEARGFYIADRSHSNYGQTSLSFASTLNMDYIDSLLPVDDPSQRGRKQLWELIQHSEVRAILEGMGYRTVAFSTSLPGTELKDADLFLTSGTVDELIALGGVNPFERMLAQTSAALLLIDGSVALPRFFPDLKYPYRIHRARILNILDHLESLPLVEGPKFVFAHLISPHPPFVFGPNGEAREDYQAFTLAFGDAGTPVSGEDYLRGYRDQVVFLNRRLETALAAILENSSTPPIIVLMGDHGPEAQSGTVSYTQERMSNLFAIHVPKGEAWLYEEFTPVNTFRVIFNAYFGGAYELLPDLVLYSEYDSPFHFLDITDDVY